jgi:4-amino-4-deoxy-L-arabinose transferase-like glycosyltransferase
MLRKPKTTAVTATLRLPRVQARWLGPDTWYALVALLVPAFTFLYGLDAYPLRDNNEGLYAEIAREMLATGQYVVPHLNGVPYIEKPPLLYWLMSISMALFGPTAAAARLVSALSMLALCAALFQFCRVHGNARAGCFASIGLASAVPVAVLAHVVLFDPLLCALLGMCLLCFLHSHIRQSRPVFRLAAFLLALAILEKGAVALVLAAGTVAVFLLLVRDRAACWHMRDPAALAIVLLVAGSWHVAAALMQSGFAWFYFINEQLLRFLGRRQPDDFHRGPPWFYLPRMLLMLLPWTPFLLLLVGSRRPPQSAGRTIVRFCQAAVLFPFVFFSLSQAKADYYLLVAAPGLALWLAFETVPRLSIADRRIALCWGVSASCVMVLLLALPNAAAGNWSASMAVLLVLGCTALATLAAHWFRHLASRLSRELALLAVALLAVPALALVYRVEDRRAVRDSSWYIARIILSEPTPPGAVLIYRDFEDVFSTLPFYLERTVPIVDSGSRDLMFGCARDHGVDCLTPAQFRRLRARMPVAVAVQAGRVSDFLAMAGSSGWRVAQAGDRMVFFDTR